MNTKPGKNHRLRFAARSVEVPPFLEGRVRYRIRAEIRSLRWPGILAVAASVAILCGVLIAYQFGHFRFTAGARESYIASLSTRIATLMRVGLADHINCAFFRDYPEPPPTVEDFAGTLNPQYAGLIPIVRRQVPLSYQMTLAHECLYNGRTFVHFSFKKDSNILSLVITRKVAGETFRTGGLPPELVHSGLPIYRTSASASR